MSSLENLARKLAKRITDKLPDETAFVLILANRDDIGSASNVPRKGVLLALEAYVERINEPGTTTKFIPNEEDVK